MKKTIRYDVNEKTVEKEVNYIPFRYILAVLITLLEVLTVIGIVAVLCYYVPYFYLAAWATEIFCVIRIIASDDNPDYKVPWLLFVLIIPIAGFMLYFMFYSRTLQKKFIRRLDDLKSHTYKQKTGKLLATLKDENPAAAAQAKMLCDIAETHLFTNTKQEYFPLGEDMFLRMLTDLEAAEKFIYMEYFIIEEGKFWDSILDILKRKAAAGVEVKVLYDDIGCMMTLPGDYHKTLRSFGIDAIPFSRLRGNADSEFNNRSHRKITVIDGKIGYTGGVNIADEYINEVVKYGHWKDTALRLEGEAVWELTNLFTVDFGINVRKMQAIRGDLYPNQPEISESGYLIPFGDGQHPIYQRRVGKSVIQNMLSSATQYAWMTSPYLIIDNDLCTDLENAALRGVDVRIIVPHIPDKKLVFGMTQSFYHRLMAAGVRIYEYKPGFIHAKSYLTDDQYAMIGTINLDYRSLVHHFENGVWMYRCESIRDLKADIEDTLNKYRVCGIIFLVMNLALSLMIFFMVYWNRTFNHHEITTIALAAYTFTSFTLAIVNMVKYRKYNSPVYSASKAISFASAFVSMLTLESTMLTTFSDGSMSMTERRILLGVSGGVISVFIITMAIYMIVQGTKKIKLLGAAKE